jgi:hypothetical protein
MTILVRINFAPRRRFAALAAIEFERQELSKVAALVKEQVHRQ